YMRKDVAQLDVWLCKPPTRIVQPLCNSDAGNGPTLTYESRHIPRHTDELSKTMQPRERSGGGTSIPPAHLARSAPRSRHVSLQRPFPTAPHRSTSRHRAPRSWRGRSAGGGAGERSAWATFAGAGQVVLLEPIDQGPPRDAEEPRRAGLVAAASLERLEDALSLGDACQGRRGGERRLAHRVRRLAPRRRRKGGLPHDGHLGVRPAGSQEGRVEHVRRLVVREELL